MFKLSPGGTYTVLHSFCSLPDCSDGSIPLAGLIADGNGNLYGTTFHGGAQGCNGVSCGVVFKLSPEGTETVLYAFSGGSDGLYPDAGLIADGNGNLYGTTEEGGANGGGTVFKLGPETPFLAFNAVLDIALGSAPYPALAFGSEFTLSSTAPAIDPVTQSVTLQAGNFATTISAGSFINYAPGAFYFKGLIGSASLEAFIVPTGTLRYKFYEVAYAASLTGITNPVPVTLTIGPDTGTISVNAYIVTEPATAHRR